MNEKQFQKSLEKSDEFRFIAPSGKWQCFFCLQQFDQMNIQSQNLNDVYLICAFCEEEFEFPTEDVQINLFRGR